MTRNCKTDLSSPDQGTPLAAASPSSRFQRDSAAKQKDTQRMALPDWADALTYTARHAAVKNLMQVAASLTYTTTLAIVPMLTVVLALFTAFPLFSEFQLALESFLANNLMPPAVSDNIMEYLNLFASKASGLTTIGTVFLVFVSISVIMTIDTTLNNIWNVQRQRPFRQRLLVYWAIVTLGPILAGASLWTSSMLTQYSLGHAYTSSTELRLFLSVIPVLITGAGLSILFVMVPNRHVYWRDALAGGFASAIFLAIMKVGFAYYLRHFPSYTIIYGAFATVPIFLLWVYLSWLGILFGATLAAILPTLRLKRWAIARQCAAAFVDSLYVLQALRETQGNQRPGYSLPYLAETLHVHQDELNDVLDSLQALGFVVATQRGNTEVWVLACDTSRVRLGDLVDALLIDRHQPGLEHNEALLEVIADSLLAQSEITLAQALDCLHENKLSGRSGKVT